MNWPDGTLSRGRDKAESLFASAANSAEQKTRYQCEIEATDRQIDQLVYELYGLKEDEIKVVETDDESRWRPFRSPVLTSPEKLKRIVGIV